MNALWCKNKTEKKKHIIIDIVSVKLSVGSSVSALWRSVINK